MPNPKSRHSKTKTRERRAHDFLTPAHVQSCPNCGGPVLRHRVCPECGQYRGKIAVEMKTKA